MTEIAPYGTWTSPISAADVARGAVAVSFPAVAGDEVWWQESRPTEGGRVTEEIFHCTVLAGIDAMQGSLGSGSGADNDPLELFQFS